MQPRYVRASDLSLQEIEAGASDGTLVPWRKDLTGTQWFKQGFPTIKGTPREVSGPDLSGIDDESFCASDPNAGIVQWSFSNE